MPPSKFKQTARAASFAGLPAHPAVRQLDPLIRYRMGESLSLRLPDEDNSPSAATVLRSEYTVGSDAAGLAVFGESFSLTAAKLYWNVTSGTVNAATGTTAHPQSVAFYAEARAARMVAMRVSVTYIGVEQESAGFLSYCEKIATTDVMSQTVDALHTGSEYQGKATEGVTVYVDYTQRPRWEDPAGGTFMQFTFPMGVFIVSGLPVSKTSLFRVRVERFMEYLPVEGALAEGELMHEPANHGTLTVHGELSGPGTSIFTKASEPAFLTKVKAVANAAYHLAQPMLPYVVPKATQYLRNAALRAAPLLLTL